MSDVPKLALSVRQPWAWAIIHAGKDVENRDWKSLPSFRGRIAIHASSGMTRDEYEDTAETIESLAGRANQCPAAAVLARGAIIGSVEVVDVQRCNLDTGRRLSPWAFGPVCLVLRDPVPCEPIPCKGQLGFFEWQQSGSLAVPAKWMLPPKPKAEKVKPDPKPAAMPLFGGNDASVTHATGPFGIPATSVTLKKIVWRD